MSAQTHNKLNVWPRHRQVEKGADHAPVLLLIHGFSVLVRIQDCRGTHRCRQQFGVVHAKLLDDVLGILALVHKRPIHLLLDLKTEEELQLTHHGHLKLSAHILCKLGNKIIR